jgi:hypothetical protein
MGTWGSGNFQNDTAADFLSELTHGWIDDINGTMEDPEMLEADEYWGEVVPCLLEMLCTFSDKGWVGTALPKSADAQTWKKTYMNAWYNSIDGLEPDESYKEERKILLINLFDKLIDKAKKMEEL